MSIFELRNPMQSTRQSVMSNGTHQSNFSADTTTSETTRNLTQSLTDSRVDASWKPSGFYLLMAFRRKLSETHQHKQLPRSPGGISITICSPFTAILDLI